MIVDHVDYGPLVCCPPAFKSTGVRLTGFWVKGDPQKLDLLCRRVFTEPSGGTHEYVALGDYVMITWGHLTASSIPWKDRGGVPEPQVAIWVPTAAVRRNGRRVEAERFCMFVPYIWVDNAMSLATGRETLGYPKAFGAFGLPVAGQTPSWTLEGYGLNWGPDEQARMHRLLEVRETGGAVQAADEWFETIFDVARNTVETLFGQADFRSVFDDFEFFGSFFRDALRREMRQVFFKQFRTAEDGEGACLQQIVEGRYKISELKARPLANEYTLSVHHLDSAPLFGELGLRDQEIAAAYEVKMDFEVGEGRVLWDAATAGAPP